MTEVRTTASVHGRFQPFHNGHLEYVLAALERCEELYVGITQYRVRSLLQVDIPAAAHRGRPESNPFTYFERLTIIRAVLTSYGIPPTRYTILPFPIEEPADLPNFLPVSVPIYTTTYDNWNRAKIEILKEAGYQVHNLWTREAKEFAGSTIRNLIRDNDPTWIDMVPSAAVPLIQEFSTAARLNPDNL